MGHRAHESRRLLLTGVFINLILALAKIAGGILGRSNALIADGIESSLDVLSSAMMWGAIKYAERPPDSDHPYGHGKMESLAAVAGSLLLIVAGAALGVRSIHEIFFPHRFAGPNSVPAGFTLVVLGATIVLKESLFRLVPLRRAPLQSKTHESDSMHHRYHPLTSQAAGDAAA